MSSFSEGGHIRANRSFDLLLMLYLQRRARPAMVMHSQDHARLEINSVDAAAAATSRNIRHKRALYVTDVVKQLLM